ncbi:MAG: 3-isopropylmalate dehydratase small subunit [Deltaproteobacteria bacterium]|nr:3-isopropylmalate dehydratase small subunit [Deltaproteobacteria bacterium]
MKYEGRVWIFGDHVDTDVIIPARFLNVSDKDILAQNCFTDLRPEFAGKVRTGDIIVGGINFGCGSSREHAPLAIKSAGVSVIIARSYARIFYRNAFNIGLPLLESEEAGALFSDGDRARVDLGSGKITNTDQGREIVAKPIPDFMMGIISAGGLVAYIKAEGDF